MDSNLQIETFNDNLVEEGTDISPVKYVKQLQSEFFHGSGKPKLAEDLVQICMLEGMHISSYMLSNYGVFSDKSGGDAIKIFQKCGLLKGFDYIEKDKSFMLNSRAFMRCLLAKPVDANKDLYAFIFTCVFVHFADYKRKKDVQQAKNENVKLEHSLAKVNKQMDELKVKFKLVVDNVNETRKLIKKDELDNFENGEKLKQMQTKYDVVTKELEATKIELSKIKSLHTIVKDDLSKTKNKLIKAREWAHELQNHIHKERLAKKSKHNKVEASSNNEPVEVEENHELINLIIISRNEEQIRQLQADLALERENLKTALQVVGWFKKQYGEVKDEYKIGKKSKRNESDNVPNLAEHTQNEPVEVNGTTYYA